MMSELSLQTIEGIPNFWMRIRKARRRFLMLDYDGTLAPFKVERMEATPLPGTVELLTMISQATDTRLAILSGRPITELLRLTGPLKIEMAGSHGFEFRDANGRIRETTPDRFQLEGLNLAQHFAVDSGYEARIERKLASIAFHTRGISDETGIKDAARHMWLPVSESHKLELRDFNGGVELRATGSNKGTALTELLLSEPDDTLPVYIGDDETDEDAFRTLQARGIGIKVGGYGTRTAATGRLPNCEAVAGFLRSWYQVTRNR
jgi:trehalose 6-phosphate phosphatase